MLAGFARAARTRPGLLRETAYAIAGRRVRLRTVGLHLAGAVRDAWTHLESPPTEPAADELLIELWDEREAGVPRDPGADRIDPGERFPLQVSPDSGLVGHRLPQVLSWLDRRQGHVVGCVADGGRLSAYERGRPIETPLLFWLRDRGVPLVHAGLVARHEDGVLLLGRSGAGKSTAALACVSAGFDFLGDDKAGLSAEPGGPYTGFSLTSAAHLEPHQLARFPGLASGAVRDADPQAKAVLLLSGVRSARLRARATLRALAVVRIAAEPLPPLRPASRREALVAAGLSTVLQLPIDRTRTLATLADLVTRVPAYWLDLGPDLDDVPRRVGAILTAAAGA